MVPLSVGIVRAEDTLLRRRYIFVLLAFSVSQAVILCLLTLEVVLVVLMEVIRVMVPGMLFQHLPAKLYYNCISEMGRLASIRLTYEDNKTYLNGYRYFRTYASEVPIFAPNCY